MLHRHRMQARDALTNPLEGRVHLAPFKAFWYLSIITIAVLGGIATFSWAAATVALALTLLTLCLGHSIGLHRLLIHRSFECSPALERVLVTLGILVGMGGPLSIVYMHEIRDWAQRHPACHDFFTHQAGPWRDMAWQLLCRIQLDHPPRLHLESQLLTSRYYRIAESFWPLFQLPLAALLYTLGGSSWVVWGIFVRLAISLSGHWFVGYLAHNRGQLSWIVRGAAVQGFNVSWLGLWSMGEAWHNNHHAFPGSARLGLDEGQRDPGWWALQTMARLGLVWNLKLPKDLEYRQELQQATA